MRRFRSRRDSASMVLLSAVVLLFAVVGPIGFMAVFAGMPEPAVDRMSKIGQAYGGISVLLSGGATIGVVIALVMQARQLQLSQAQAPE